MDMEYVRACLRSERPPIELQEFTTTYRRTRVMVNLAIIAAVVALNGRFDNQPVVVSGLLLLAALAILHAFLRRRSKLIEMVTADTLLYLAMAVLVDLPAGAALVVLTQSFLVFFHVKVRTSLILIALYIPAGLVAATTTVFVDNQRRTAVETALLVSVVMLLATIPTVWVLLQAAVAMYQQRDKEERLSREKDELLKDKDRFVASVSHELRTPLTAVVGLAHTLAEAGSKLAQSERDEFIGMIVEQSEEVAAIVDDLLVTARAGTGHLSLVASELDLGVEVAAVISGHFDIGSVATTPIYVIGDPIRVRQILRNLMSNCMRYGGPNKRVRIYRDGFSGVVAVEDDGPAIPTDQVDSIFSPYGRVHDRPGRTDSVGLGLTVSRQLAEMMGGDVRYSHDGTWAAFSFRIPIAMHEMTEAMYDAPDAARLAHRVVAR